MALCKCIFSQIVKFISNPSLRSWDALPNPDAATPKAEKGLLDLFVEIRSTVGQEAQIVQAVFPNPPFVMQVFLQRVFAQSVSSISLLYATPED
jgi:hypothetical protein